jgi:hypothetical protein
MEFVWIDKFNIMIIKYCNWILNKKNQYKNKNLQTTNVVSHLEFPYKCSPYNRFVQMTA